MRRFANWPSRPILIVASKVRITRRRTIFLITPSFTISVVPPKVARLLLGIVSLQCTFLSCPALCYSIVPLAMNSSKKSCNSWNITSSTSWPTRILKDLSSLCDCESSLIPGGWRSILIEYVAFHSPGSLEDIPKNKRNGSQPNR